jgi:hypothetical protein
VKLQPSLQGTAAVTHHHREYRPGLGAPDAVAYTWHGIAGWSRRLRVLPDGCLELVWDGQHARAVLPVPGPARYPVSAEAQTTGIRIQPGWGAIVLGAPLRHLAGVTDVANLWDTATARHLEAALAAAPDAAARRHATPPGGVSSAAQSRAAWRQPARRIQRSLA